MHSHFPSIEHSASTPSSHKDSNKFLQLYSRVFESAMGSEHNNSPIITIKHPSSCLIAGPTGCGKTRFVARILETANLIEPAPTRIVWVYSEWQPVYEELSKRDLKIEFKKNTIDTELYESFNVLENNLLILDDQMSTSTAAQKKQMTQLFTQGSHHRNLTLIYIVQNLFEQGPSSRTISLNAQYIIVFKNPRDSAQISYLAREIYPKREKFLIESYLDATHRPHSYIFLNLTQGCEDWCRVSSHIFPGEETEFYIPIDIAIPDELLYKSC